MRRELERIYLEKDRRKRHLMSLKNKYLAIIYDGCLKNEAARRIHKRLYDETINNKPQYADKFLLGMMIKMANRAKKIKDADLATALFAMFWDSKISDKAEKVINHTVSKQAEMRKQEAIDNTIADNRDAGRWFYLASSHADCAKDHIPYQGRLYVDEKAPPEAMAYAKSRGLYTVQWVMGAPAWFITRPNCRHYFVSLTLRQVEGRPLKRLKRKYKTHTREGDREFQTPKHRAVEEYRDRLEMLRGLYRIQPTEKLKRQILKAEMLLKKWENM